MEQSPSWEANSHWASQEIPRLIWNPKVNYRVHNSLLLVPTLSQIHSVHKTLPNFPKIHFNITFPSTPTSSELSLPFRFPTDILHTFLISPMRATRPAHHNLLDLIKSMALLPLTLVQWDTCYCRIPPHNQMAETRILWLTDSERRKQHLATNFPLLRNGYVHHNHP